MPHVEGLGQTINGCTETSRILEEICSRSTSRSVRLGEFFRDFDPLRRGECSQSGLNCILTQLDLHLNENDRDSLLSAYISEASGRFNYRKFLRDCDTIIYSQSEPLISSHIVGLDPKSESKIPLYVDPEVLAGLKSKAILMLQAQVYEKRVSIRECFHDFDHLRKGFIPPNKLRCVLSLLNFHMTEEEIQVLTECYANSTGSLNYVALCDDIDKDLICEPLEKNPLGVPPAPFDLFAAKEGKKPVLSMAEQATMTEAEERIKRRTHQRGINLLPQFRSYDKYNRLVITDNQFSRAMKSMGFEVPETHFEVLFKKYCIHGSLSRFAYRDFCASIDA